ncbi:DUF3293 domain-containing protein [Vibrio mytili]|uniref:DUF3293 domain-containing protein n=1 Tax=Vibrio mytili TaxID=50718 RepID=A0A0C3I514_9VIBR|nr:DUF3293 domain-containing protein [Vibrio mytili]KIN09452.1 hypothetical protein SU60_19335 [Vibrio mytili]
MIEKNNTNIEPELWNAYSQSFFRFGSKWDAPRYVVITAWNPYSKLRSKEENIISNQALEKRLTHKKYVPVTVGDSDFEWKEESFAVETSLASATSLAKAFHQYAIYYVENGTLYLVACSDPDRKHRIGEITERLV